MKNILLIIVALISVGAHAGGRVSWATPIQIDIERGNGVMVYGNFGNPNNCTMSDMFYIKSDHPEFEKIYSALMIAYTSKKKITAYIHECSPVPWYSVIETTYNTLTLSGDFKIKD